MIVGDHCVVRSIDADDAEAFHRLYLGEHPPSALLDRRREFWVPTLDETRELLGSRQGDVVRGLCVLEDREGMARGFCAMRTHSTDNQFGNFVLMFFDAQDFEGPMADDAVGYLVEVAFSQRLLRKVMGQCFDNEREYRALLLRHGFESDGVQRDVVYSRGRWYSLESFTRFNPARASIADS